MAISNDRVGPAICIKRHCPGATSNMQNIEMKTIREIAVERPVTTRLFERYKIDYCCHGDAPFKEACLRAGESPETIKKQIDDLLKLSGDQPEELLMGLTLNELTDHIVAKHHIYTKQELEQLTPLMNKVARKHGEHNPLLLVMKELFQKVCADLTPHMTKEERVLFPYIRDIEDRHAAHLAGPLPPFAETPPSFCSVLNPVRVMRMEHDRVGALLAEMRSVSNDYELPGEACPSFTALYHRFAALESDLHHHIHLENNVLFPQAIELEQKIFPAAG